MAVTVEAFKNVTALIYMTFLGSPKNQIDPLFQRSIEMGIDDKQLYFCVNSVVSAWCILFVMWVSVVTPTLFSIPDYIQSFNSRVVIIYVVCSAIAIMASITALYIGVSEMSNFVFMG